MDKFSEGVDIKNKLNLAKIGVTQSGSLSNGHENSLSNAQTLKQVTVMKFLG